MKNLIFISAALLVANFSSDVVAQTNVICKTRCKTRCVANDCCPVVQKTRCKTRCVMNDCCPMVQKTRCKTRCVMNDCCQAVEQTRCKTRCVDPCKNRLSNLFNRNVCRMTSKTCCVVCPNVVCQQNTVVTPAVQTESAPQSTITAPPEPVVLPPAPSETE
jgi:hypothetical protein